MENCNEDKLSTNIFHFHLNSRSWVNCKVNADGELRQNEVMNYKSPTYNQGEYQQYETLLWF